VAGRPSQRPRPHRLPQPVQAGRLQLDELTDGFAKANEELVVRR
jgi:hypothetical protein